MRRFRPPSEQDARCRQRLAKESLLRKGPDGLPGGKSRRLLKTSAAVTLTWSSSMDRWQALRLEFEREAEAVFATSGQVVVVAPDRESRSILTLVSRTKSLKLTWLPEQDAVRSETGDEYSFDRNPEQPALLARSLMRRVHP